MRYHFDVRSLLPTLALLLLVPAGDGAVAAERVIAAANSTCVALRKVGSIFARRHGITLTYICKSSGLLAKGVKGGAIDPDYYVSANEKWMNDLVKAGFVEPDAVRILWGNELVLAAPRHWTLELPTLDEIASSRIERVLIGDPGTAPFGRYAKQALTAAGLWNGVRSKVATRKHITLLADDLAVAGAGTVGILFSTNLNAELTPVLRVSGDLHDRIRYYGAPLTRKSADPLVSAFAGFIESAEADAVFGEFGFKILP